MSTASQPTSDSTQSSAPPTELPVPAGFDVRKFAESKEGLRLAAWIQSEYAKAKQARTQKQLQWYTNMAFFFGKQYVERMSGALANGFRDRLVTPKKPYYAQRRTINRVRSVVRSEISRFVSTTPVVVGVPASADDEDVRAAYAAEQAWRSIESSQKLKIHFGRAMWWMSVTGNGFIKCWWDQNTMDKASQQQGCIKFSSVTPFHLFVPDIRESDIEDQPYLIQAQIRSVEWCQMAFTKELAGRMLKPSVSSGNQILDDGHLNLSADARILDSCVVYETWVKPGSTAILPSGGVIITIDDKIVRFYGDGFPYDHGQFPFTKFEHIPSATFYADSPLVDMIPLQQDYNRISSQILESAIRMGRPQLLIQKGSVATSKVTNEIGSMIEYRAGAPAPTPLTPAQVPDFVLGQRDALLSDIEDITGQHDVTRGQAPTGVTAGTAISYLQEKDNQFLTPEYVSIEDGYERLASQSIQNFVQYVDLPRKIKTIGADQAFDTIMLEGADLRGGTDVRVEPGSSVGTSQAAKRAQIMEMWGQGLITDPNMALAMMEVGGEQRALDILNAAERKAKRENMKMKLLNPQDVQSYMAQQQMQQQMQQQLMDMQQALAGPPAPDPMAQAGPPAPGGPPMAPAAPQGLPTDPLAGPPPGPDPMAQGAGISPVDSQMSNDPTAAQPPGAPPEQGGLPGDTADPFGGSGIPLGPPPIPPMIPVDDFDVHPQHILTHNIFRMSQEYEMLDPAVKEQFDMHVKIHMEKAMQGQLQQFFGQIPGDGSVPPGPGDAAAQSANPNATLAGNGAAPAAPTDPTQGGQPNG